MKVIVCPHELVIGGSPINAIDLAAAVGEFGHEAIIYAPPGPLIDYIASKGLRYFPAKTARYRPALNNILALASLARSEKAQIVHAYEWPACLDAVLGPGILCGCQIISTVLSMGLDPILPRITAMIVGTEELASEARTRQLGPVSLMEPPIDTDRDSPVVRGDEFRRQHGVAPQQPLIVTVSRLAIDLKLDALMDAIAAAHILAKTWPVRLIIVGEGKAGSSLRARAATVNEHHRREVVTFAGASLDPRPAYAAADIVVGMGMSSLRALSHEKPVVVQGEKGFNAPFDADHEPFFLRHGFYGIGDGSPGGPRLAEHLSRLLSSPEQRALIGRRGRQIVVERFSLRAAARRLAEIYETTAARRVSRSALLPDALRSGWLAACTEIKDHLPSIKRARSEAQEQRLQTVGESF